MDSFFFLLFHSSQFHSLSEGGLAESPLTVSWFAGKKPGPSQHHHPATRRTAEENSLEDNETLVFARLKQAQKHQPSQPHRQELVEDSLEDNEALVFAKMKQAQQRNAT